MIKSTDCLLVMGRRGCGKSYLSKNLQKMWPRRVIIDSLNEYNEGEIVHSFHEFSEALKHYKSVSQNEFALVYQFDPEHEESEELFNQIMRLCYYFGNIQVVIEEVQLYSSPHFLPKWLKNNLLIGRHQDLSLLFTSQRPGEVNKTIISQCAHIFCGQILEGNDLRYVSSFLNEDASRLSSLPERKFIYKSDEGIAEISNNF